MVSNNDFAPAEWKKLVQAPLLAGFTVTAADPSSFVGTLQEAFANAKQLAEAKTGAGGELVKAVAEEILTSSGRADAREGIRSIAQGCAYRKFDPTGTRLRGRACSAHGGGFQADLGGDPRPVPIQGGPGGGDCHAASAAQRLAQESGEAASVQRIRPCDFRGAISNCPRD